MPIDVSVIVPVFNPGAYLQPLLDSLDRQTIGDDRFEAIFVDDGSDDGSAAVLDQWAATRVNAVVVHQENHGWPGQPRNVGLGIAQGEYVQFVDQDDWLGDTALSELHAFARAHASDVVIGKMVGVSRGVPVALFSRTVPRVELGREPVQDSQTPHKMFRRAFLDEIALRFPEGKRRLEDHVFVTTAFLCARTISIYADTDCYFHIGRPDGGNAGYRTYDPVDYYRAVEEVLDIVDELLEPGRTHDTYADRWLRIELTSRLHSRALRILPRRQRNAFYREISRIVRSRYTVPAICASRLQTRISAAVVRHASPREFWRFDRAVVETTAHVWPSAEGTRIRLFVDGRERPATAHVSDLLNSAVPRIAEAVLADLGDDPPLLTAPLPSTAAGGKVAVPLATGIRTVTTAPDGHRPRRVEIGVDRLVARTKLLIRRVLGRHSPQSARRRRKREA